MDLSRSTLGSRPVEDDEEEDEDEDDCVVTHVVLAPGRNTVTRWNSPAAGGGGGAGAGGCGEGLQRSEDSECTSSLASFVGVKKERAENGALYVLLEVNEKQEQEDSEKQEEEDGSQAQTHDKCVQEENLHCVEENLMLQESCEDHENQQVLIQQEEEEECLEEEPQKKEEEENREKRPTVDLTPFLSFLSDCIRESKADQTRSCSNKSIPDDDDSDGEDVFGRGSGINFSGSVTAGGMSDCRIVEEEEEEIIAAVVTTVPTEEENFLHDGDDAADQAVVVEQPLYPPAPPPPPHVPGAASRDVSSSEPAAAAEDEHEENIARIQDCVDCYDGSDHEGCNNGRSFLYGGLEEADDDDTGFEEDDTRVQEAAEHQEQKEEEEKVQCVGTDSSEQQQQLQQQQHAGRDEDHDSAKEQQQQIQGISLDHMALHQAVSSNLQTSSSKAAPPLGVRRNLLQAHSMFDSWCEIDHIKKAQILSPVLGGGGARATVSSVVAEFQKPSQVFESSNSRFLSKGPLEDDSSSSSPACSSQSHTVLPPGWLRMISKPGSEVSYIDPHVRRRRTSQDMKPPLDKAATAEAGHGGESALCSSSIEAEPEEDIVRSQTSEEEEAFNPDMMMGISTVAVATTKYYHHHDHHFKPNCRAPKNRSCIGTSNSPRKVPVMKLKEFKYVESWKGLMPTNGQDPDKERQKVIQALYTFEELRQKLREAEELRVAKGRAEGLTCLKRPDLKAATEMRLRGLQVNTNEYIGNVPGIGVGDRFWYRIEMVVIGLHKQLEAGIAFISKTKARVRAHSGTSVATSIVMKHWGNPYRDDIDNGEFITYTGQGGLSARSSTAHCIADQVLTRGNEALKNSYKGHWPIRVIRGDRDKKSPTGEVYTYIGLYQILHMRYEPGKDGNLVYMFDLKRQGGQQPLPICASPEPNRCYIANKPGSSTSMTIKRKWEDLPHAGGDNVASSPYSSSRGQWGIPLDFSNTNQTLYVRRSS